MLLVVDIGNTHTHYALADGLALRFQRELPTRSLDHPAEGFGPVLQRLAAEGHAWHGLAFCSVVPTATTLFRRLLERHGIARPVVQVTPDVDLGVPITYPQPYEIGQDRLANAAGAAALGRLPAVVVDIGTAVTFDVVASRLGYVGGVIAPGIDVMRRYLHERTAQLPLLDDSAHVTSAIGRSTVEAMRIGLVTGFAGMLQALLDGVLAELRERGEPAPHLISTGSGAGFVHGRLRQPFEELPGLTLQGLAAVYGRTRGAGQERGNA